MADITLTIPRGLEEKYLTFVENEEFTEIGYLGSVGVAKSDAIITSILKSALEYPGCRMALCRDELTNLKRTTLAELLEKEPRLIAEHNKTESIVTFPEVTCEYDGLTRQSKLYCFGLMSGDYKAKLKSLQPFRIFIDEADKLLEEMLDMCIIRVRQKAFHYKTGEMGRNQVKYASNDEGNTWLWRRLVGKPHPGKAMSPEWVKQNIGIREVDYIPESLADIYPDDIVKFKGGRYLVERTEGESAYLEGLDTPVHYRSLTVVIQRLAIYAFSAENKSLNVQNLKNARGISKEMRDKYFRGKVDVKSGLMFTEWDANSHIIPTDVIPPDWRVIVGIDHGLSHPTAAVYLGLNRNGDVIIFDEYQVTDLAASENAYEILGQLQQHRSVRWVGGHDMFRRDPRDPTSSIAHDYEEAGIKPLRQARNTGDTGPNRVKELLALKTYLGEAEPRPKLYVMEHCHYTIERLANMKWEEFRLRRNDDLISALMYALSYFYSRDDEGVGEVICKPFALLR